MSKIEQSNINNTDNNSKENPNLTPEKIVEKNDKHKIYNISSAISPIIEKISNINYSAINSSIALVDKMVSGSNLISPIIEKVATINYSAISNSMLSIADKINSMSNSIYPIIEKSATINYSAIASTMLSVSDSIASVTNIIPPIVEKMSTINFSLLSNAFSSLGDNLVKLSLDSTKFSNFIENFETLSKSIDLDNIDITEICSEDTDKVKTSSLELVEKVATGTLDHSDFKNNRPQIYALFILKFLLAFIFTYMLTRGLDYVLDNNITTETSNEIDLISNNSTNLRIVIADILNVRDNPSTQSNIVAQLNNFDIVKVINEQPYWFEIEYIDSANNDTKTGWIAKRYTADYLDTFETYLDYFSD